MAYCKFCGDTGRWRMLSEGKKHFFHQNHDCGDYIARKLAPKCRQLSVQSFTRPTRCDICGGECFYYENEKRDTAIRVGAVRVNQRCDNLSPVVASV